MLVGDQRLVCHGAHYGCVVVGPTQRCFSSLGQLHPRALVFRMRLRLRPSHVPVHCGKCMCRAPHYLHIHQCTACGIALLHERPMRLHAAGRCRRAPRGASHCNNYCLASDAAHVATA